MAKRRTSIKSRALPTAWHTSTGGSIGFGDESRRNVLALLLEPLLGDENVNCEDDVSASISPKQGMSEGLAHFCRIHSRNLGFKHINSVVLCI